MIKRSIGLVLLLLVIGLGQVDAVAAEEVNGELVTINGQRVLRVWGTPHEMGYAQGYLLAQEIRDVMTGYVLGMLPLKIFEAGVGLMPKLFDAPEEFQTELAGILAGMEAAGPGTYIDELGRYMTPWDLMLGNCLADIRGMACSSVSAWNEATADDPMLEGELAIARNMDWTLAGEDEYLLSRSTLLIAYSPSDPDQQRVISVSFPGFIGCLSCMNESGVVATQNMAHNGIGLWNLDLNQPFQPINMVIRQGLAERDVDGDGVSTILDVQKNIRDNPRTGAYLVHTAQPNDGRFEIPAEVIETDNGGFMVRHPVHMPVSEPNILLATNHFLLLRSPLPCNRMRTMKKMVRKADNQVNLEKLWDIERNVMQDWLFSTTVHTMLFIPARRELHLSYTDEEGLAGDKIPAYLAWDEIFPDEDQEPELPDEPETDDDKDDDNGCGS